MKSENIDIIISGCINNERRAQEILFRKYYGKMLVVVYRYISDRDTAQEVLQNAFIKIFEKLSSYNNQGSFEGWVRRIVANTSIDYLRKNKNIFYEIQDYNTADSDENPLEQKESNQLTDIKSEMALKAIELLSPAYRMVFNMYVMEEYTHKQIAEKLGVSEGTSKSNLAKARAKLNKILSNQFVNLHQYE